MNSRKLKHSRYRHEKACESIGLVQVTTIFAHPDDIASIEQHAAQLAEARGFRNAVYSIARLEEAAATRDRGERAWYPYPYIKPTEPR